MNIPLREFRSGGDSAAPWHPGKLWSLWEMVTVSAQKYLNVGIWLEGVRTSFMIYETVENADDEEGRVKELKNALKELIKAREELGLSRAQESRFACLR